jgi:hypothetical protein
MPVLMRMLPSLADPHAAEAVATHLAAAWSRPALPALITAFRQWAPEHPLGAGRQPGNTIAAAAGNSHAADVLALAVDARFGTADDCLRTVALPPPARHLRRPSQLVP